jgi:hypothetical protein
MRMVGVEIKALGTSVVRSMSRLVVCEVSGDPVKLS